MPRSVTRSDRRGSISPDRKRWHMKKAPARGALKKSEKKIETGFRPLGILGAITSGLMATAKFQAWTNATWIWDSAAADTPCVEVLNEMRNWITAINLNASQSGKQVVLLKDENSSTAANFRGYVIQLPMQNQAGSLYHGFYSNTTANLRGYVSTGFTNDTSNSGYGTHTGTVVSDTTWAWKNTVTTSGQIVIGSSTVDGEEFFVWGWNLDNSASYGDCVMIFKDERGEWAACVSDGAGTTGLTYDDLLLAWRNPANFETTSNTAILLPMSLYVGAGPSNTEFRYRIIPASPDLLYAASTSYSQASYVPLAGGDNAVLAAQYGPFIRYTPV